VEIAVPRRLLEEARKRGISVEDVIIQALSRSLGLDPREEAEARLELARRFLEEADKLVEEGDVIQASEKLYKAAEEAVKAAAIHLRLRDILEKVEARGRWTVTDLERVVRILDKRVKGARSYWDAANYLHVWGFHEARLDREAVIARRSDVRRLVELVERLVSGSEER